MVVCKLANKFVSFESVINLIFRKSLNNIAHAIRTRNVCLAFTEFNQKIRFKMFCKTCAFLWKCSAPQSYS